MRLYTFVDIFGIEADIIVKMKDLYKILKDLDIQYQKYEHPAVFTVEDAEKYASNIKDDQHRKNLFLRNKKGDKHYLVIVKASKKINIKQLEVLLSKDLSFASPERLLRILGLTPGSVSPFGLINDSQKEVQVIIDSELLNEKEHGFHPNINTSTLVITAEDFKKFLEYTRNEITYLAL